MGWNGIVQRGRQNGDTGAKSSVQRHFQRRIVTLYKSFSEAIAVIGQVCEIGGRTERNGQ